MTSAATALTLVGQPGQARTARLVVLVSGEGTNLQAILDSCANDPAYGCQVVAVGADRPDTRGQRRAQAAGVPTFVQRVGDYDDRMAWDAAITAQVQDWQPDVVVCAGFMKVLGPLFISAFRGRILNCHPALLPAFPGAHAVAEALDYGVRVSGVSVHFVDVGLDTGPIIAQQAVPVLPGDDVASLHERIKAVERPLFTATVGQVARQLVGASSNRQGQMP